MEPTLLARLKRLDDERAGFAGEHWFALSAGLWLLSHRPASTLGRLASLAAGAALVYRASTGRDGLVRALLANGLSWRAADRAGRRRPGERYVDVAAPWPYTERVRVAAISQPLRGTRWAR